jgi:hypothetical protein
MAEKRITAADLDGPRFSIQPLRSVAHLLAAGALEQTIVKIGLVLVWHDPHEAHQRTAARAMWRTDRERLGLVIWRWHAFLRPREIAYVRTMAPRGRVS